MNENYFIWVLARHGESEANAAKLFAGGPDTNLTETGEQQAADLGEKVVSFLNPDIVISSTFKRAVRTRDIAVETAGYQGEVETDPDIGEVGYGISEGLTIEETREEIGKRPSLRAFRDLKEFDSRFLLVPQRTPLEDELGIESAVSIAGRTSNFVDRVKLMNMRGFGTLLTVAHMDINAYLIERVVYETTGYNLGVRGMNPNPRETMNHFGQKNTEVSILPFDGLGNVVVSRMLTNVRIDNISNSIEYARNGSSL